MLWLGVLVLYNSMIWLAIAMVASHYKQIKMEIQEIRDHQKFIEEIWEFKDSPGY